MGIQVGDNFDHKSKKPLDNRTQYATLAAMKAVTDANMNEGCLAYCVATDKYYKFLSSNSVDADTGKWREFESGGGGGASALNDLSDVTITSATSGQVLKNNGSGWVNGDVPTDATRQPKTLDTPLTIDGSSVTTVEGALGALNTRTVENVGCKTLDVELNNGTCVTSGQTKFYTWKYQTGDNIGTTFNLPEIPTVNELNKFLSYYATIIISAYASSGTITVIYDYETSTNAHVAQKRFYKIATKRCSLNSSNLWVVDSEWSYPSADVLAGNAFDFSRNTFDIFECVEKGRTTVFWGTSGTGTTNQFCPVKTGGLQYLYTFSYNDGNESTTDQIFIQCIVVPYPTTATSNFRMFFNVYSRASGGAWTLGDWSELGGGSVDTSKLYSTDDTAETAIADTDYFPFQDVSASGKRKTLWSNVKSVLKTYFDTLYSGIFTNATELAKIGEQNGVPTYDGQIISLPTVHNFDKANLYSTTEQVVGKWTDGRPLYQRTYTGAYPSASGGDVSGNLFAFSYDVKNVVGFLRLTTGGVTPVNTDVGYIYCLDGYISCYYTNTAYANATYNITLQYTKSTDAANSFNYASENDYSTSETIVGKWIDGSTLYQRTITGNFPSNSSSVNLLTNFTGKVIKWSGYAINVNEGVSAYVALPSANGQTYATALFVSGSIVTFSIQGNLTNVFYGQPYYVTIQYTKS